MKGEGKKDRRLQIKFSLEIENFLWGWEGVPIISRWPNNKETASACGPCDQRQTTLKPRCQEQQHTGRALKLKPAPVAQAPARELRDNLL